MSMTKERSSESLGVKMKFFPKKGHSKNLVGENFFHPPKLSARSPPMHTYTHTPTVLHLHTHTHLPAHIHMHTHTHTHTHRYTHTHIPNKQTHTSTSKHKACM